MSNPRVGGKVLQEESKRRTWRQLLERHKPLVLRGAHDAMCARLIE
jgi:2-methylisocitrate lyase-like PEP mutase family enzyme